MNYKIFIMICFYKSHATSDNNYKKNKGSSTNYGANTADCCVIDIEFDQPCFVKCNKLSNTIDSAKYPVKDSGNIFKSFHNNIEDNQIALKQNENLTDERYDLYENNHPSMV